jgi:hypothetical protein
MQHVWGEERCTQDFGGEGDLREGGQFEDPGVDRMIILQWILNKWDGGGHGPD